MILSLERKFVFIKTRKTAGTSIEIWLSPACSSGDVITTITPSDEIIRRDQSGTKPQNFSRSSWLERRYQRSIHGGNIEKITSIRRKLRDKNKYWNHMSATDVRETLPETTWNNLFKFTIERHPYEKAVSLAYFRHTGEPVSQTDFESHLDQIVKAGDYKNFDLYSDEGGVLVDEILRYEDLPDCLAKIKNRLGPKFESQLPFTKNRSRGDKRPASEILNTSQKDFIREHCQLEFDLLGYDDT